jgi:very-long-chain enoyl-CoA reductase
MYNILRHFEPTWYNLAIEAYVLLSAPFVFIGQLKAEDSAVAWSKFAIGREFKHPCTARTGMLCKYVVPLGMLLARTGLGYPVTLPVAMLLTHFTKRCLEVLFVHSFTGSPTEDLQSSVIIGAFYAAQAWCYVKDGAHSSGQLRDAGLAMFCVGLLGNLWHHSILANLRRSENEGDITDESGKYKIPRGGLFSLVTCPHYFFECLGFWGIALVCFTLIPLSLAFHVTAFLSAQASSTTRWYKSKFGAKWPANRRHMIPFIF